jgi:hypothetical protein
MRIDVGEMSYEEVEATANGFLSVNFFFKRYGTEATEPVVLTAERV